MPKYYWEDFVPDSVEEFGPRTVTREEIVDFAAQFDPQPMHLDEEAARETMLGGLGASGWHTCAMLMRMLCDGFLLETASQGSPGVEEVRWMQPVRPATASPSGARSRKSACRTVGQRWDWSGSNSHLSISTVIRSSPL